jgi:hypothetical protein
MNSSIMETSVYLKRRRMLEAVRITVYLLPVIVAAVWVVTATIGNRQIPFDSSQWRAATRNGQLDDRYRMIDDLQQKFSESKDLSYQDIIELLGPPDSGSAQSHVLRYGLGRKAFGPIRLHGFYLRVQLTEDDSLLDARVVPE